MSALLIAVASVSFHQAIRSRFDFSHFYRDARYVWEHGGLNPDLDGPDPTRQRQLPFYLPVVPLILAPVTWAGLPTAAAYWAIAQTLSLALVLWVLREWCSARGGPIHGRLLAMCVLGIWTLYEATKFNQLSLPVLAVLLLAFRALERGRSSRSGALFGLAAVLKLLPAFLLLWLLLKRQWSAVCAWVVTAILLAVLPPLICFGPQRTIAYHRQWFDHNLHGAPARGMTPTDAENENLADHFTDRRNQALPAVLARLFCPEHPHRLARQALELDATTCVRLARGVLVGLLAILVWKTRRPWWRLTPLERRAELGLFLLGMMIFSPLLRQYYLVWALPALLVFVLLVNRGVPRRIQRTGSAGLLVWLLGMLAWTWEPARVCGAHWLMLTLLAGFLLTNLRGAAVPQPSGENFAPAPPP